jgi:hypothetical protein
MRFIALAAITITKQFITIFKKSKDCGAITKKSILYWAKQDAFQDYDRVKSQTIDYYIEEALASKTEFDIAQVLKQLFKDKYVCYK